VAQDEGTQDFLLRGIMLKILLTLSALLILPWSLSARVLESPQDLTLTALEGNVWQMTWEPILDDQLMGYSVFSRRGKGDFTKITKVPVTAAIFKFKGLDASRPVEMVVLAEYEDGRSEPSLPVFSSRARRSMAQAPATPGNTVPQPNTAGATAQEKPGQPSPQPEMGLEPTKVVTPFTQRPLRDRVSMLTPHRQWRTHLAMEGQMIRTITKGYDRIWDMPMIPGDWYTYDLDRKYQWERYDIRVMFRVPLRVSYGFFPGLEIGRAHV
jgi:hypothetical protein